MNDVTQIHDRVHSSDLLAAGELLPLVYQELRRIADGMNGAPISKSASFQPAAATCRFGDRRSIEFQVGNRAGLG